MKHFGHFANTSIIALLLLVALLSFAAANAQPAAPGTNLPQCSNMPANAGFCIGHPAATPPSPLLNLLPDCSLQPTNFGFCIGHPLLTVVSERAASKRHP